MDNRLPASAQAGPPSEPFASQPSSSQLHHKPSLASTSYSISSASVSGASSSSHRSYANLTASSSPHAPQRPPPNPRPSHKSDRIPIYIRIVPKDTHLRIHIDPSQTIGRIKDAALHKVGVPEHDPTLNHRFYQDAVNASSQAKLAGVASQDKVVKHRSYALPRGFVGPGPDLGDVDGSIRTSLALGRKPGRRVSRSGQSTPAGAPPVPPLPSFDNAYSPRGAAEKQHPAQTHHQGGAESRRSQLRRPPPPIMAGDSTSSASGGDNVQVTRQISTSSLATSPPSTPSDFAHSITTSGTRASETSPQSETSHSNEIATIRLDADLVSGNRDAKLEEEMARLRMSQWNSLRSSSNPVQQTGEGSRSPPGSFNSTPTIASSSNFGSSEPAHSPNMGSSSPIFSTTNQQRQNDLLLPPSTPPRGNKGAGAGAKPATFYTTPGASESFNSLASLSSPSSAELVTTADDESGHLLWGTQAEVPLLSPSKSTSSAAASSLSSPTHPSAAVSDQSIAPPAAASTVASPRADEKTASSPHRPRSRTVTAADILRSRNQTPPPPMPESVASPTRKSSLPKIAPQTRKMVAEDSQRREMPSMELLDLLKGSPNPSKNRFDYSSESDQEQGVSTARSPKNPPPGFFSSPSSAPSIAGTTPSITANTGHLAGLNLNQASYKGLQEAAHPLSVKFSVLSASNGCELEDWQKVSSYNIRPFEMLLLQWAIPTERVYIPPVCLADLIRPSTFSNARDGSVWREGEMEEAGPSVDSIALDSYWEGWMYLFTPSKAYKGAKRKNGKWKLHYLTIKAHRMELYGKKPRAGEAQLPVADTTYSLRNVSFVVDTETSTPHNAALPALEGIPQSSISVAFTPRTGVMGKGKEVILTLRCVTGFDHNSLHQALCRAWYRSLGGPGGDLWRRKALFRSLIAGRGGTVAPGKLGRNMAVGKGRNAKARTRMRPSGWGKQWDDADCWSSDSELEEIVAPFELEEGSFLQQRRDTLTQLTSDQGRKSNMVQGIEGEKVGDKVVVPGGLYAALLGRTYVESEAVAPKTGSVGYESSPYHQGSISSTISRRNMVQSPSLPHMEPGLMLGPQQQHTSASKKSSSTMIGRQRSGSLTRSPESTASHNSNARVRSLTVSSPGSRGRSSAGSSRNVSREASPLPTMRKGEMAPAIIPGFINVAPPANLALLHKYKASQQKEAKQ